MAELPDLADLRREYPEAPLLEEDVDPDPLVQFRTWLAEAVAAVEVEPNAMVLSTVGADGQPSARTVLLKGVDDGFVFFTSRTSRKGREIAANPAVALTFFWRGLSRQVTVQGTARPTSDDESDAYFAARPLGSRLGAWASEQSAVAPSRRALDERLEEVAARFADGDVPRPPAWGGYRVVPHLVELWQGRPNRLHDRLRYRRQGQGWRLERLFP